MKSLRIVIVLVFSAVGALAQAIPPGTALPIMLSTTLDASKIKAGQPIRGRIMQDVRPASGVFIPRRAEIFGRVVQASGPSGTSGSRLVLEFDRIRIKNREIRVQTAVRAVASMVAVAGAQQQTGPPIGFFNSSFTWTTNQVGGETVYRGGGQVMAGNTVVGTPDGRGGVLAELRPTSDPMCGGEQSQGPQSLWIFATSACGAYGMRDVTVARDGRAAPQGRIVLESKTDVLLRSGSGLLLITIGPSMA